MPFIGAPQALARFREAGRNSSHFVWLLAGLRFYECSNGWVFGFTQVGKVTLLALEPLIPGAPTEYSAQHEEAFRSAWDEFKRAAEPRISAFVAVYEPFRSLLERQGFQGMKVGEEPWVDLTDCIPRGNAGKGVRSARNQAIHAGLRVTEWMAKDLLTDPGKRETFVRIHAKWAAMRPVALTGFMNSSDPLAHLEDRRYFVLESPRRVEGYLVATPVPGIRSYFLEDMVFLPNPPRGAGELLTLEAMVALEKSGARLASLGVISMSRTDATSKSTRLPKATRFLLQTVPHSFSRIHNFRGLEIYRKRFKPHRWEDIHLCIRAEDSAPCGTAAWLRVLVALLIAFKPTLQITPRWLWLTLTRPVRRYPLTVSLALIHTASFAWINRFGRLPPEVLERWGFAGNLPLREWIPRSVVSDFLYFSPAHFLVWGLLYGALVFWAERKHKARFLLPYLAAVCVLDDILDYLVLIKPFEYLQPGIFRHLVAHKDVGSSLSLATLAGLQLHQLRKLREPVFAIGMFGLVLALTFSAAQLQSFILDLDHVLFLLIGYLTGKVLFELSRRRSRQVAKGKPPVAGSVRAPSRR